MEHDELHLNELGIGHAKIRLERDAAGAVVGARLEQCNDAFVAQTGVTVDVGDRYLEVAFGHGAADALRAIARVSDGGAAVFPQHYATSDRWFSCHGRVVCQDLVEIALLDVTDYRAESEMLMLRERAYRSFIEHLQMIAFLRVVSPEPKMLFTAGSFREITGYGPEQGISSEAWLEVVHPDDRDRVRAEADRLDSHPDYDEELEYRIVRRDGQVKWVRSYDRQFTSDDGTTQLVQGLIIDVTEQKRQEEALREANDRIQEQNRLLARLARTDALTGLLNRRAMQEQLERELRLFSRGRSAFSILLIDLDEFKEVNDRHGHRAGDRVLMHLAEALSDQLRASDVQSRWGGEEFMVLLTETDGEAALKVSRKLLDWFASHPTVIDGTQLRVTFTGGVTEAREGDTVDTVFSRADKALYQGKNGGRNRIVGLFADGEVAEAP